MCIALTAAFSKTRLLSAQGKTCCEKRQELYNEDHGKRDIKKAFVSRRNPRECFSHMALTLNSIDVCLLKTWYSFHLISFRLGHFHFQNVLHYLRNRQCHRHCHRKCLHHRQRHCHGTHPSKRPPCRRKSLQNCHQHCHWTWGEQIWQKDVRSWQLKRRIFGSHSRKSSFGAHPPILSHSVSKSQSLHSELKWYEIDALRTGPSAR